MEVGRISESEIEKEFEQEILYSAIEDELNKNARIVSRNPNVKKKKKKLHLKKEIKIRTLLLLIVTLIMNTYAWFIYISTVSVGGVAGVAGIIAKVKSSLDKTKEQMNTIIEKKEASTKDIDTKYSALIDSMEAQNKKIEELTKQISKIEK